MRLLIINPNTTEAMTAKVAALAQQRLPDARIAAVSGRFGPAYIASRASFAIAGHAALDAFAAHGAGADIVLLACFGDPGLDALREMSPVPVIGLVEASVRAAAAGGRRFSIVTGGALWDEMLREMLLARGLLENFVSIRAVAPDGGMIARDPDGAIRLLGEACDACVAQDGAEAVILGGAGLIGLAARIGAGRAYPVICSVEAGLAEAMAMAGQRCAGPDGRRKPVDCVGLSPELSTLMASAPQRRDTT